MASPFNIFRKNQKVWMVALTVLAMISFLFLGNIGSSPSGGGTYQDPEVFSWKFGKVNASDLRNRLILQQKVQQFFHETGKALNRPEAQMNQFIVSQFPTSENGILTYMMLNKKAEDLGIVVSDNMVLDFIKAWTEKKVSSQQLAEIVKNLPKNTGSISQAQLFDAIRFNLAANYALQTFQPNLMRSQQYMNQTMAWFHGDTPAERWDYFERLNRKATTEIMPVAVKDFVEKVPEPTATELQTFYDEYKNAYPVPASRTPGFREPYKAQIEYVKADNAKMIEDVLPTITDAEVQEYYDKFKGIHFRKLGLPSLPEAPSSDAKADPAAGDAKSETSDAKGAADSEKKADEKADEKATPDAKKDAKDAAKATETKAGEKAGTKSGEKANSSKSGSKSSKAGDGKKSSAVPAPSLNGELLALADDPIYLAQAAPATDAAADAKKAADAKSADAKAADEKAADSKAADSTATTDAKGAAEPAAPDSTKAGDDATKPADTSRVVEYEPLEKVAGQAKNQVAQQKVDAKVLKAFVALQTQMSRYRSALEAQHAAEIAGRKNVKQAQSPDLEALAKEHGLQYKKTGLITDREAVDNLDIGKSRRPVTAGMRTAPPQFVQVAFSIDQNSQPFVKPFAFEESDDNENNHYLWWKVADQLPRTPPLADIKQEVVQAWKQVKARKLASDQADAYAAEVNKSKKTLKEAFGETPGKEILTPGPFSWLTRPAEQPFARPRPSEVTGLDLIGYEFFKSVFKLRTGEAGVAPNNPLTVYYVVQMQSEEPPVETLRQNFMTAMADGMSTMPYAVVGADEHAYDMQLWFGELEKQYGVKMNPNFKSMNSSDSD